MNITERQAAESNRAGAGITEDYFRDAVRNRVGDGLAYDPDIEEVVANAEALRSLIREYERVWGVMDGPKLAVMEAILNDDYALVIERQQNGMLGCSCDPEFDPFGTGDRWYSETEHTCHYEFIKRAMA
jgi:hypothetical protein